MTATRVLWALYLGCLAVAVSAFAWFVVTGNGDILLGALAWCYPAWIVAGPLEGARLDARVRARSAS